VGFKDAFFYVPLSSNPNNLFVLLYSSRNIVKKRKALKFFWNVISLIVFKRPTTEYWKKIVIKKNSTSLNLKQLLPCKEF